MTTTWSVGELAEQAGVSVRTLHHYDEIGLLTPARSVAGHRRYTESDLVRLTQVVTLRSLGLSLGEVQRCLDSGEALTATLTRQLHDLDERVAQTTALRDRLASIVTRLQSGGDFDSYDLMTLIGDTKMLTEGKTKIIEEAGGGEVLVRSKDDITAGDGAESDVLEGKAAASTRTTSNIFQLLERHGVRTHFVDRVDDVTFRARRLEMIPLELVARRYATGSFSDRFPHLPNSHVFDELMFEVFEKDDANHDPLLDFDFEAGVLWRHVPNTKDLLVADVIDSDSGRLRFGDVDMSKQSYRDGTATLPEIKKKFDEVAALTDHFV